MSGRIFFLKNFIGWPFVSGWVKTRTNFKIFSPRLPILETLKSRLSQIRRGGSKWCLSTSTSASLSPSRPSISGGSCRTTHSTSSCRRACYLHPSKLPPWTAIPAKMSCSMRRRQLSFPAKTQLCCRRDCCGSRCRTTWRSLWMGTEGGPGWGVCPPGRATRLEFGPWEGWWSFVANGG